MENEKNTSEELELSIEETLDETQEKLPEKTWKKEAKEWAVSILIALAAVFLINKFVFVVVNVEGDSMLPTVRDNDKLIVTKMGYQPNQGDIIVFIPPNDTSRHYIKRVIATEGQSVLIDYENNKVYVDGMELDEDYVLNIEEDVMKEIVGFEKEIGIVPEGHCFVMGDNRNNSKDSRSLDVGFIDHSAITGKVVFRFFPFRDIGTLK